MSKSIGVRLDKEDEQAWEAFKKFVVLIHGKKHTVLGKELAEAMRRYMKQYGRDVLVFKPDDIYRLQAEGKILQSFFTENNNNGNGLLFGNLFPTLKYKIFKSINTLLEGRIR